MDDDNEGAAGGEEATGSEGDAYLPEGMPEHLRGANDRETIDKLLKAYTPLREAQSRGKPSAVTDYGPVAFSDEFKASHGDLEERDGDVMALVREVALESEMSPDLFAAFVPKLLEKAVSNGLIEKPLNADEERAKAGGTEAYQRRLTSVDTRLDGLKEQGVLTDEEVAEAKLLNITAAGLGVVEKLLNLGREQGVQPGGQHDAEFATMEAVKAAMDDDRYDTTSHKYDPAYVERVRAAHRRLSPKK